MKHTTTTEISGTHLQGYVTTTRGELTRLFGSPWEQDSTEKVTLEWGVLFEDGTIATVYDWKRYEPRELGLDEEYQYHVGGLSPRAVELITQALEAEATK
jgi:hypothetical protein